MRKVLLISLAIGIAAGCTEIVVDRSIVKISVDEWLRLSSWHTKVDDCFEGSIDSWIGFDEKVGPDYCDNLEHSPGGAQCGKVEKLASTNAFQGDHVLRVSANDQGVDATKPNNHVIAYRRVMNSFAEGWWRYRFAARIPRIRPNPLPTPPPAKGTFTGIGQTGPEFSLQNSRFESTTVLGPDSGDRRLITYTCGIQYLANTWDPPGDDPPEEGQWNIWVQQPSTCNAYWQRLPTSVLYRKLDRDKWYHFEFTVNFDTMRYGRFVIREHSASGAILDSVDLSCFAVFGEWKWKTAPLLEKFEMSLEVTDQYNRVGVASVEQYEVHYDCARLAHWEANKLYPIGPWPILEREYEFLDPRLLEVGYLGGYPIEIPKWPPPVPDPRR